MMMMMMMEYVDKDRRRTRRRQVSLPDNIIFEEILIRLSAKILSTFKSVSKLWYNSISDQYFIKLHLDRSRSLPPELIKQTGNSYYYDDITKTNFDQKLIDMFGNSSCPLASCDGLLLVNNDNKERLYVCNPVIGQFRMLPSPPVRVYENCCQFLFDNAMNQYKIVIWTVNCEENDLDPDTCMFPVFTFTLSGSLEKNIASWKKLSLRTYCICDISESTSLMLNHKVYWVAYNQNSDNPVILSMDISTEEIREIQFPNCCNKLGCKSVFMKMKESLYFVCYDRTYSINYQKAKKDECCVNIWSLEDLGSGKKLKWTKLHGEVEDFDEIYSKARRFNPCDDFDGSVHFDSLVHLENFEIVPTMRIAAEEYMELRNKKKIRKIGKY